MQYTAGCQQAGGRAAYTLHGHITVGCVTGSQLVTMGLVPHTDPVVEKAQQEAHWNAQLTVNELADIPIAPSTDTSLYDA